MGYRRRSATESLLLIGASLIPMALIIVIYSHRSLRRLIVYPLQFFMLVPGYFVGQSVFRHLSVTEPPKPDGSADYDSGPGGPVGPTDWGAIEWGALLPALILGFTVCVSLRLLVTHEMVAAFDYVMRSANEDNRSI